MSVNPISQRLPVFDLENPQGRQDAHRYVASGIVDLNQAVASLKTQLDTKATATASTSNSTASTSTSTGVTTSQATTIANTQAAATIASTFGGVNQQSTAAYTVQSRDYGGVIVQNSASASTITLNPLLPSQYFTAVENLGAGTVTLQPGTGVGGTGTINGAATLTVATGAAALLYYDGMNWWAVPIAPPGVTSLNGLTGALSIVAGSGIAVTPAGSTITIAATGAYLKGSVSIAVGTQASPAYFTATATVAGATTSMAAIATAPIGAAFPFIQFAQIVYTATVTAANTVTVAVWVPGGGLNYGTIPIPIIVFP